MIFRLSVFLLAFIIPFGLCYIYVLLLKMYGKPTKSRITYLSLCIISGFCMMIGYFIYLSQTSGTSITNNGKFTPAILGKDKQIIQPTFE
jgi:bacteriorhodopsin